MRCEANYRVWRGEWGVGGGVWVEFSLAFQNYIQIISLLGFNEGSAILVLVELM